MAKRVLISGANGFIAAHIVNQLLENGHEIVGTVRDPANVEKNRHLTDMEGASDRLTLVAADLNEDAAFDRYTSDVDVVLHTASPYVLSVGDPQRDLVDPAVRGTVSMLRACAKNPGVKRVVLTSSVAAITDEPDSSHVLTEADWNTRSSLERNPYYYSKAEAERAAWQFMETQSPGFELVVINPFLVIGPSFGGAINTSNQILVDIMRGKYPAIMGLTWGIVDVRDVADAHVRAMNAENIEGRYICAAGTMSMRSIVGILRDAGYPGAKIPSMGLDNAIGNGIARLLSYTQPKGVGSYLRTHVGRVPRFDNSKIRKDLGLEFRGVEASVRDTLADLARWGHLPKG